MTSYDDELERHLLGVTQALADHVNAGLELDAKTQLAVAAGFLRQQREHQLQAPQMSRSAALQWGRAVDRFLESLE